MSRPCPTRSTCIAGFALGVLLLAGCGDEGPIEITDVRELPRLSGEQRRALSSAERLGLADRNPAKPRYRWTLPEGWAEQAVGPMQMRDASFQVPGGVDVSVLIGMPSDPLANLNRWRGQMGLEAMAPQDLAALRYETPAGPGVLADLTGTFTPRAGEPVDDQRFLGFLLSAQDHLLSVRMLGPAAAVEASADQLHGFLRSLARADGTERKAPVEPPDDELRTRLAWELPEGWTGQREPSGMRIASFRVQDSKLDVPLIAMEGQAGGLDAILAMWAGGVGRAVPTAEELASFERFGLLGGEAIVVELLGSREVEGQAPIETLLLGVVCFLDDQALFLRMQGRAADVTPHRAAFLALARSLRIGE